MGENSMSKSDEIRKQVCESDCYNFKEVKWDRDPKFIIDVGANVGWFSYLAAEKKPNSTILSYELVSDNYEEAIVNLINQKTLQKTEDLSVLALPI